MNSWFSTPERIAALDASASSWIGTPFGQNGNAKGKGGGVSCQKLAAAVLIDSGCLAAFDPPAAPMGWARHNTQSLIEPYMDSHARFHRLVLESRIRAGDVLGFKIGACVHHMGVALDGRRFLHVWQHSGVMVSLLADPTYSTRLAAIWRATP